MQSVALESECKESESKESECKESECKESECKESECKESECKTLHTCSRYYSLHVSRALESECKESECKESECKELYTHSLQPYTHAVDTTHSRWRRPTGCLKLQVIFRKRATNYRALLPLIIGLFRGNCAGSALS